MFGKILFGAFVFGSISGDESFSTSYGWYEYCDHPDRWIDVVSIKTSTHKCLIKGVNNGS